MVEFIQKGYRNPTTGFPDYQYRGREFTGQAPWVNEAHDSDMDGVPNYLDSDPLNPNVQQRPLQGYGLQGVPQEVPVSTPTPATAPAPVPKVRKTRKKIKKSKRKK